jgi:hypothetical protein
MTWPIAAVLITFMVCATSAFLLQPHPKGLITRIVEHDQAIQELRRTLESVRTKITFKP